MSLGKSERLQALLVAMGLVLFVAGAWVTAAEPAWTTSPSGAGAALIAAGLTLMITMVARMRRERRDEVVVDERVASIDERGGNRAFQASFAVQGVLFAVVSVTSLDPSPEAVLGTVFTFTALAYLVAYNLYRRRM